MKKVISVIVVIISLILLSLVYFVFDKDYNYMTIDINPSIKLYLDEENYVVKMEALNEDARKIIDFKIDSKRINDVVNTIVNKAYEKGYAKNEVMDIVLYSTAELDFHSIMEDINGVLSEKGLGSSVYVVDTISKEDEELARKEGITAAKAALINQAISEHSNLSVDNLVEKSVGEIKESKETGNYCQEGYTLHGDWCEKVLGTYEGERGEVCPRGYSEYEGTCYLQARQVETGRLLCEEGFTLEGEECVHKSTSTAEPIYKCENGLEIGTKRGTFGFGGIMDGDTVYCIDKSNAVEPTLRCLTHNHTIIDGKCANGPKPVLPFGCEAGDYLIDGGCYDIDTYDQYVCPDGNIYEKSKGSYPLLCPDTFKYYEPTIDGYKCPDNATLEGNMCIVVDKRGATREVTCDGEGTLVNNNCLVLSDTKNKEDGIVCDRPNSRMENNKCVVFESIPALSN